ncbi:NSFL1 cofactor p47 [Bombus vancouverensis nearcticus]|uniref:NSFL1 cofactor p47 n=2 Tax=Pyrobombus TaxID=144703 RepID=A0A6P8M6E1_9HYME|nr:NSFL1 cofactor p47 [Bombus impatiens]XP_033192760.1 NSFL1 cofactor p47 [Bombus vancouverensis nearcticus]XP_033305809.1 NSFL1 cofactor p47 [Bombus bifarius]XP_050487366.1 NSFL1 cofactor p47-like [Bombus huntii]
MANHDELVSQFIDTTGVEPEEARFYLELFNWQLEVALDTFYYPPALPSLSNEPTEGATSEEERTDIADKSTGSLKSSEMEGKSSKDKAKPKPKFAMLSDLKDRESSPEDEEGQAFYAGGSEHTGQQILGPGKKKDIVSDMFKSCQRQSIAVEPKPSGQQRPNTFSGTGYKLGQTSSDTEIVTATSSNHQQSNSGLITLKLWKDGFTINDSELRLYSDPENREFLETIKRGEIPAEIRQEIQGTEARLDMEDHHHEMYVPPKVKVKAFSGKGHMLGSPSPATVGMTIPADLADQAANESQAKQKLNLDESKPVTTIQIRLADGTNVKAQFNLTHTINDLRQYIITMRPQYAMREFSLLTMYPTKEITEDKTIEEAGLQNTTIIQRLK